LASFVLVHGAWHGGWSFDPVAERLRAAGHTVIAPDLPGMGGDEQALRAVTLAGWGAFIAEHCRILRARGEGPVILAGHSRGGLVISEAGEQAPEAIDALVYICALMLPQGVSRTDFRDLQQPNPDYDAIVRPLTHGAGTLVDPELAPAIFAQLSPPDLARAAAARLVAEPTGLRTTPMRVSDDGWGRIPRTYIECRQDRTIPLADQRLMQEMSPGSRIVSLDCDHSPFLSDPDGLTRALLYCLPGAA